MGGWRSGGIGVAHQKEQEASLDQVEAAAGGVRTQLEKLLVDITELAKVTGRQNILLQEDIDVVRGRQAVAATLTLSQLIIVLGYFIVIGVLYIKKCVKKHQERLQQEQLELMDQRLQERRSKRRAAARAKSSSPQE